MRSRIDWNSGALSLAGAKACSLFTSFAGALIFAAKGLAVWSVLLDLPLLSCAGSAWDVATERFAGNSLAMKLSGRS